MKFVERNKLPDFNELKLPFPFLAKYEAFVKTSTDSDYLLAYSAGLNAIMPFRQYSVKGFPLLQPLWTPMHTQGDSLSAADEKLFLNEVVKKIADEKIAIRIIQGYSHIMFNAVPDGSVFCPFGSYVVSLTHSSEELFNALGRRRAYIKDAEKQHVNIKWGMEQVGTFYDMYKQTMDRSGIYCEELDYFTTLYRQLNEQVLCGVAYLGNVPQGGLFMPYTQYGASYLYGATANNISVEGAMYYLHWHAMLYLKAQGVERYDLAGARLSDVSGSKLEGIQNFKRRLGGELVKGYLWKIDIDSKRCRLFDILMKLNWILRGKKAYRDIIDEENSKARLR